MSDSRDGRQIDPEIASLLGEAAGQVAEYIEKASAGAVYDRPPSAAQQTYYNQPSIKEPVWKWAIPTYFYLGGAAGAALTLGAAAQLLDGSAEALVTHCRRIGLTGVIAGTGLLIYDLGRPSRFLNMLRVFRPTSPMNLGSWVLSAAGSLAMLAALPEGLAPQRVRDAAAIGAGVLGLPLSGYTGVLLANSVVPVWQQASRTMPVLFIASGMAGAGALLHLLPSGQRGETITRRFAIAGQSAELAAMFAVEWEASRTKRVGRPLKTGISGFLWNAARVLGAASLGLSLASKKSRNLKVAAGLCGTAAALSLRFSLLQAGRVSARDPHATFEQQRRDGLQPRAGAEVQSAA